MNLWRRLWPDAYLRVEDDIFTHAAFNGRPQTIVLQADERIPTVRAVVAGEAQDSNRDFALMRLWL